jgi:hypothetical protein
MRDTQDSINQNTFNQGVILTERLSREAYVLTAGTIGGAIAEAAKHPAQTICDTAEISLAAASLTALAVAELPLISSAALATGAIFTGKYVFDLVNPNSVHNRERNGAYQRALYTASQSTDWDTLYLAVEELQKKTGVDSLQVVEGLFAGGAIRFGFHVPGVIERLQGPQLDFATNAAQSKGVPTWNAFSHSNTPTYEEFVNFKAVPGTLRTTSLASFEKALEASGETPQVKPRETAAYRTASKKNDEVIESNPSPAVQGTENHDIRSQSGIYFKDRFGST